MVCFGTLLGLIAGYYGGITDTLILRVTDVFLAFPHVLLAIGLMAALGPGVINAMIALGFVFTPRMIRLVRASCLAVKENEYVEAAKAAGIPTWRTLAFYFLPNIAVDITTYSSISTGQAILYIAALGFLGLGAQPPTPEWGAMISTGSDYLVIGKWWPSLFPGVAIYFAVMGFILFGHGLRDALDPRMR
jgi:peptide/nickel transport system permease protein